MGKLWRELLTKETITRGWHIARSETKWDFSEDLYSAEIYGTDLPQQVQEAINRLLTNTYQPRPLFKVEVPKGPLAFRPGAVIPIKDRTVLSALVLLMAADVDEKLPDSVFSWRLKNPVPKKGPIFNESDITALPFLKKTTIREEVDPFEGWYRLWPVFDEKTRRVFQKEGYRFLATSDISAYFENIQLPILRDHLMTYLPREPQLVNLMCHFLESWCDRTGDGRVHYRGIPQGNSVSSFLGNIFLLPLDNEFIDLEKELDIRYFRYMDDVRIFTKSREDARRSIMVMARVLRSLHLNIQTAKTRIYDEYQGEITGLLIDDRVDDLTQIIDELQTQYKGGAVSSKTKESYLKRLSEISRRDSSAGQKIIGARSPLEGLSLRAFSRWITAHALINSDIYVNRLLLEIAKSADSKLTKKLISTTRRFPRKRSIETRVMNLIDEKKIIFPYQEAECIRAIRYLGRISDLTVEHSWKRVISNKEDRYLRMESAYLLSRTELTERRLQKLVQVFESEPDPYIQTAIAGLLVQRRSKNQEIVQMLVFHPNEKVRDLGRLFRAVKNIPEVAKGELKHALRPETPWILCDCMPFLHLMAASNKKEIKEILIDAIREPRNNHEIVGLREIMKHIFTRTRESLNS